MAWPSSQRQTLPTISCIQRPGPSLINSATGMFRLQGVYTHVLEGNINRLLWASSAFTLGAATANMAPSGASVRSLSNWLSTRLHAWSKNPCILVHILHLQMYTFLENISEVHNAVMADGHRVKCVSCVQDSPLEVKLMVVLGGMACS